MNDRNVWAYIEGLPGQAAPWYEWRFNLEKWAGFQNFQQRYLKLTSDRAMAIECPTDCGLGCPRKVVEHAVNDIVAVCPDQEEGPLQIEQRDILIYKINQSIFHGDLCLALGIEHRGNKADNCRRTWRLGDFIPTAGIVYPVYYTHPQEEDGLAEVVRSLCLLNSNPFVVITPTRRYLSPVAEGLLAQRKAIFLALNEEIIFTGQSGLKANRSRDSIFRSFIDNIPKPDSGGMVHFNTPAGINWGEITIQFVDGHTVSIQADHVHGRYNYTQMGMANTRSGNPTVHWTLFGDFAENRGTIDNASPKKTPFVHLKKRKQDLSKRLKDFFRLEDDPIEWIESDHCYRCRFTILPEGED